MKHEKQIGLILGMATLAIVGVLHVMRETEKDQQVSMMNQAAVTESFIEESQIIHDFGIDTGIELPVQFEIADGDEWKNSGTVYNNEYSERMIKDDQEKEMKVYREETAGLEEGLHETTVVIRNETIHMVSSQDNLSDLSRRYYGDAKRWREIYEANRNIIEDPDTLKVGVRLRIPESI